MTFVKSLDFVDNHFHSFDTVKIDSRNTMDYNLVPWLVFMETDVWDLSFPDLSFLDEEVGSETWCGGDHYIVFVQ